MDADCLHSHTFRESHLLSSMCFGPCRSNRMCVSECPRGFWGDRRRCKRCFSSCESCTGSRSDQCTSCQPGHHLTEGTSTCTATCGDNYYLDHGWISGLKRAFINYVWSHFVIILNNTERISPSEPWREPWLTEQLHMRLLMNSQLM